MRGKYGMPYYMGLSQVSFFYLSSERLLIVYVYFVLCMVSCSARAFSVSDVTINCYMLIFKNIVIDYCVVII